MVQEFVSFGNTREEAIDNFIESQGYDFDSVKINGTTYVNGEVLSSKVTATSFGTGNAIVFNQKDWKFAKAMWLRNHDDAVMIREYNGELSDAHEQAFSDGFKATDDSALIFRMGYPVEFVEGDVTNIKVTYPKDLFLVEEILKLQ